MNLVLLSTILLGDLWQDNCTTATGYPYLYLLCSNNLVTLQDIVNSQRSVVKFRRYLGGILSNGWAELLNIISSASFTHNNDKIEWR